MGASIATLFTEIVVCGYQVIRISPDIPVMKYVIKDGYMYIIGMFMFLAVKWIHFPVASELLNIMLRILLGGFIYIVLFLGVRQK